MIMYQHFWFQAMMKRLLKRRGFWKNLLAPFVFFMYDLFIRYLANVAKQQVSSDLVDILFAVSLYRSNYFTGPGWDALNRARWMCAAPSVKTSFFRLHSVTFPMKMCMQGKGVFVPWTIIFILCKAPETIDRRFIERSDAILFWDVLEWTLKTDLFVTHHSICFLPLQINTSVPYDLLDLLYLHDIWR